MPSHLHEVLVEMFRHRPGFAAELLSRVLGVPLPAHTGARSEPGEVVELTPTEYRADHVVVLTDASGGAVHALVVEVQLGRRAEKRRSWPVYLVNLGSRLRCPTMLFVVCVDPAIARWCRRPITTGHPGFDLTPLVLGPELVPVVDDPAAAARDPELTVLSAMAHGSRPEHYPVLKALLTGLQAIDPDHAKLYAELVHSALPGAARAHLENLVTVSGVDLEKTFLPRALRARAEARGEARGEARAVLAVLDARGIAVPDAVRSRVEECTDHEQLAVWIRRAVRVRTAEELLD